MSTFTLNFLNENIEKEISYKEKMKPIVGKWKRSGLLENLSANDQHTLALLLQNQAKSILKEASRTSTQMGAEEWSDIALPMVRKVFAEQLTRQLIHTYAQDKPNGLVFYLDFEFDVNKPDGSPIYNKGESVYGITDQEADPSGSFYGSDRYSYSNNYQKASATLADSGKVTNVRDINFDPVLSQLVNEDAALSRVGWFELEVSPAWNIDLIAPEIHAVEAIGQEQLVRQYTRFRSDGNGTTFLRFFYTTATAQPAIDLTNPVSTVLHYVVQPTAFNRGDYEQGQAGVNPIDEINIKLSQEEMIAKTRKLKTTLTPELIQDLDSYHQMDAQKEVINILSGVIELEEDGEILAMLRQAANPITRYWSARVGEYVNSRTGSVDTTQSTWTQGVKEWYNQLGVRVRSLSNEVHKRNLRGGINWAVCSPEAATILESFNTYQTTPQSGGINLSMGVKNEGTADGTIKIYKNPYWKHNEILFGFKGSGFLEAGAAYGTYTPFALTPPLQSEKTFDIVQGIMTRNAKVVLRSDYYAKIVLRGMEVV